MVVVGITGSLATGKSTVSAMFGRKGAKVLSADRIAHELIDKGGACHSAVVKLLGKKILSAGRVDRKKIAEIVFNNKAKLKKLVDIVHPAVKKEFQRQIVLLKRLHKKGVLVLDVPLLFESGIDRLADYTITVKALRKQQIKRSVSRSRMKRSEAMNRIKSQMPLGEKLRLADIIIDNSKTLIQTQKQVNNIWQKLSLKIKK